MALPDNPKLMSIRTFLKRKAEFEPGHRLVFTNGCFDVLHPGHVDLLIRARALGDALILGLNSDESVKMLGKGEDRPLNPQEDRAFVLAGLACVDYIVVFHESTPLELIKACRPQVLVKGGDWPVDQIVGADVVEKAGGQVHSLPLLEGYSTTAFLEKVRG
ncbi:D-glycero-beta-D-manno-heptose 1-phosphate adenylyltransferase [Pseudodesulfovibrio portus]|uniref:D-glycero-beta-D-manno-heptose 1-phosphate adenylyltransferase n=1 Tax=Pseudodesulfovibrio portus TaxID=231439 RepID=A0ABM8ASG4_9BACT|nr:D-glycero-beta-D-manno-heptose 1-phosphate adenylyltransferase [Pseudodesulfovibrio portus]BDQ34379.1 cytidyltransferase [Pseudodesulfovibrio portus]